MKTLYIIECSLARLPLYAALNTHILNTDGRSPEDIAGEIAGQWT